MKKAKFLVMSLVLAVLMLAAGVLFVACDEGEEEPPATHTHTWATEWSSDGESHWHACTGEGCTAIADEELHTWDEGEVTEQATYDAPGKEVFTCTVCGYEREEAIALLEHTYATEWTYDDDNHWHACTDEGYTDLKADVAEHDWGSGEVTTPATFEAPGVMTYTCECGATKTEAIAQLEHAFSDEWSYTTTHHWHACIDEGYDLPLGDYNYAFLRKDEAYHSFGEGVLSEDGTYKTYTCICGYSKTSTVTTTQSGAEILIAQNTSGSPTGDNTLVPGVSTVWVQDGLYALRLDGGTPVDSSWINLYEGFDGERGLELQTEGKDSSDGRAAFVYVVYLPLIDFTQYSSVSFKITMNAPSMSLSDESGKVNVPANTNGTITYTYIAEENKLTASLSIGDVTSSVDITDAAVINGTARVSFMVWSGTSYERTRIGEIKGIARGSSVEEYPVYLLGGDIPGSTNGRESGIGRTDIVDGKSVYWKNGIYCYNTAADEYKIVETSTVYENGVAVYTQTGDVEAAFADCIIYMPLINFSTYQNVSFKVKGNDAGHIGNLKLGDQSLALGAYEATFTCVYDEGSVTVTVRLNDPSGSQITYTITDPDVVSGAAAFTFTVQGGAYGQTHISPIINTVTLA